MDKVVSYVQLFLKKFVLFCGHGMLRDERKPNQLFGANTTQSPQGDHEYMRSLGGSSGDSSRWSRVVDNWNHFISLHERPKAVVLCEIHLLVELRQLFSKRQYYIDNTTDTRIRMCIHSQWPATKSPFSSLANSTVGLLVLCHARVLGMPIVWLPCHTIFPQTVSIA